MTSVNVQAPGFFALVEQAITNVSVRQFGVTAGWAAPVAIIDAPMGFSDEVWVQQGPDTVLAWHLKGSEVLCDWGPRRGTRIDGAKRHMTLQPRGVPNHYSASGKVRFAQLVIPDRLFDRVADDLAGAGPGSSLLRSDLIAFNDDTLLSWMNDYRARAVTSIDQPTRIEMEARALLIVERLVTRHHGIPRAPKVGGLASYLVNRVIDYMVENLAKEISLDELAAVSNLSPHHFCRAFKQSTGLPPHRYQIKLRIERAKILLAAGIMSISEVASAVGYDDQGQLARLFRHEVGTPPSRYRRDRLL